MIGQLDIIWMLYNNLRQSGSAGLRSQESKNQKVNSIVNCLIPATPKCMSGGLRIFLGTPLAMEYSTV